MRLRGEVKCGVHVTKSSYQECVLGNRGTATPDDEKTQLESFSKNKPTPKEKPTSVKKRMCSLLYDTIGDQLTSSIGRW